MYRFSDQISAIFSAARGPLQSQPALFTGFILIFLLSSLRNRWVPSGLGIGPREKGRGLVTERRGMPSHDHIRPSARAIVDLLQDEVYAFTTDKLLLVYLNKQALLAANWRPENVEGKQLADLSDSFDMQAFRTYALPLLAGEKKSVLFDMEFRSRYVEVRLQIERDLDTQPLFIAVLRDISERKREEQEMAEFVATVSHEIRSPMTSIKGALNLISSGFAGPMSERADAMIDMAQRNVERLLRLINDVLDLQKLDADMTDLSMSEIELMPFIEEVIAANAGYGHEYGVELRCFAPETPILVNLNRDGMMQALTNLLSNAVKFSPKGQSVDLVVSEQETTIRLSVTDRGPGIAPEAHKKLFSRFVQAHAQIDRQRVGTGLGLSIAKAIVEKHGGQVGFVSELGVGSTFYIDLPKADGASVRT
jgi:PAS domain S-box-containing protein